jgi:toxin CptA
MKGNVVVGADDRRHRQRQETRFDDADDVTRRSSPATIPQFDLGPSFPAHAGTTALSSALLPAPFAASVPVPILLTSAAFLIAAVCAGLMGYAIQRGATCTVAAVDEAVSKRSINRLRAMVEASIWVAGGLVLAETFHLLGQMPSGYPLSYLTVLGGVLLGLGAYINRACVFGAIARFGSGEWAYVATPVGIYVGSLIVASRFLAPRARNIALRLAGAGERVWLALPVMAFLLWRLVRPLFALLSEGSNETVFARLRSGFATRVWAPHAATTVIGVSVFLYVPAGRSWDYTAVLAALARGMSSSLLPKILLLVALFSGAALGGYTAGRFRSIRVSLQQVLKCFAGGVLMGWGGLLVPGHNDGLILIGMPLLWPYAWVAF